MSAQVAADLRAAADLLERDGWTQFGLLDPTGCMCVSGALAVTATDGRTHRPGVLMGTDSAAWDRWKAAADALRGTLGRDDLMDWNDEPERTADEVITALRAAADAAEVSQ